MVKIFTDTSYAIINKLRDSVAKYTELSAVLKGTATIRSTASKIIDPLGSYNLTGIIEILFDNFRKQGIVSLTSTLVEAFEFKVPEKDVYSDPTIGLTFKDKWLMDWLRKGLNKKMTTDQLVTGILVKSYPRGAIRTKLLEDIDSYYVERKRFEDINEDEQVEKEGGGDLPLYYRLSETLKRMKKRGEFPGGGKPRTEYSNTGSNKHHGKVTELVEIAAVTSDNGKLYSGPIKKSQGITFQDEKGKTHTYVAVFKKSEVCPKCYPESGSAVICIRNSKPIPCFAVQCDKCKMYGHKHAYCQQLVPSQQPSI